MSDVDVALKLIEGEIKEQTLYYFRSQSKVFARVAMESQFLEGESYFYDLSKQQFYGTQDDLVHTVGKIQAIGTYQLSDQTFQWAWANKGLEDAATSLLRPHIEQLKPVQPLLSKVFAIEIDSLIELCQFIAISGKYLGCYPIQQSEDLVIMTAVDFESVAQPIWKEHVAAFRDGVAHMYKWCNICGGTEKYNNQLIRCGERADVCQSCVQEVLEILEAGDLTTGEIIDSYTELDEKIELIQEEGDDLPPCLVCGKQPSKRVINPRSGAALCRNCAVEMRECAEVT